MVTQQKWCDGDFNVLQPVMVAHFNDLLVSWCEFGLCEINCVTLHSLLKKVEVEEEVEAVGYVRKKMKSCHHTGSALCHAG